MQWGFRWGSFQVCLGWFDWSDLSPIVPRLPVPPAALWSHTKPTVASSFANRLFVVIYIGHSTQCSHAILWHVDLTFGWHADNAAIPHLANKLGRSSRSSGNQSTFTSKELHIVNYWPKREGSYRMSISLGCTNWNQMFPEGTLVTSQSLFLYALICLRVRERERGGREGGKRERERERGREGERERARERENEFR